MPGVWLSIVVLWNPAPWAPCRQMGRDLWLLLLCTSD